MPAESLPLDLYLDQTEGNKKKKIHETYQFYHLSTPRGFSVTFLPLGFRLFLFQLQINKHIHNSLSRRGIESGKTQPNEE
jgi:hypothetical protein